MKTVRPVQSRPCFIPIMTTKLLETAQTKPENEASGLPENNGDTDNTEEAVIEEDSGTEESEAGKAEAESAEAAEEIQAKKPASKSTAKATPKSTSKSTLKKEQPKDPDESLLKAVSDLLPRKGMEWSGTATELLEQLGGLNTSPNIATRKLNESTAKLLSDYGVSYERTRNHRGRLIKLTRVAAKNRRKSLKKKEGES